MPSKYEYDKLLNQYNIAIAKAQDLQEQLVTKQRLWEKRDKNFATIEKLTRELCEEILAKAPEEMKLGEEYSWGGIDILELIMKSKNAFHRYTERKLDDLRRILDLAENRRLEIENLQDQISILKTRPSTVKMTEEELQKQVENDKKAMDMKNSLPKNIRDDVENGKVDVVIDDDEDDKDLDEMAAKVVHDNEMSKITHKSIATKKKNKKKKNKSPIHHQIDLREYEARLTEDDWTTLKVIGETGRAIYADIKEEVFKVNPIITDNKLRTITKTMSANGILHSDKITIPTGSLVVYKLTDIGSHLYQYKYDECPIVSEADLISADHDNYQHGYAIRFLADSLRNSNEFVKIKDLNRSDPIQLGGGITYVPDIILTEKSGATSYIEYEIGTHTQTDFNAKCNKMCKVTSVLNFVGPNASAVTKLQEEVAKWIKSRGRQSLSTITVRITGFQQIVHGSFYDEWKVVFKPGKREEPYINF